MVNFFCHFSILKYYKKLNLIKVLRENFLLLLIASVRSNNKSSPYQLYNHPLGLMEMD